MNERASETIIHPYRDVKISFKMLIFLILRAIRAIPRKKNGIIAALSPKSLETRRSAQAAPIRPPLFEISEFISITLPLSRVFWSSLQVKRYEMMEMRV